VSRRAALALLLLALGTGCRQDMHDQPKLKPYARTDFYADQRASRAPLPGTVARGQLREDGHLYTGKLDGKLAQELPFPVTAELLQRGQERYRIYCTPCHGQTGRGDGMVVRRGFRKPASFHDDRLRGEPVGYFFDNMTNGFGAMPDYAAQIGVRDRWAIAAYVKALQLSQHAAVEELSPELLGRVRAAETQK
jgi:mono/diheme cytochrome c family protein